MNNLYNAAQLMAIALSRELRNGDVVITGTNAVIPTAAYRIAQRTHAPRLVAINGALGTVDPRASVVPYSCADAVMLTGRFRIGLPDIVRAQARGIIDVIFLGALQIDRCGRCNLALIGDPRHPALRGPGTLGLSHMATVPRSIMYLSRHDARTFVESVDFVSAEGLRSDGGGLQLIVTPLAVLGPDASRERIELVHVMPGSTVDEVRDRTGFELKVRDGAGELPEPTEAEAVALLEADADGLLRRMTMNG